MRTAKNPGWNLNQWREFSEIITEEKWEHNLKVFCGHEQEIVCSDRPVEGRALDEAWLEIQERLFGLEFERCRVAVFAHRDRFDVAAPVQFGPAELACPQPLDRKRAEFVSQSFSVSSSALNSLLVRRDLLVTGGEFLETRIIPERIEHRIEPEQRRSEWHTWRQCSLGRYRQQLL